jgi:hypothetical protein
MFILIGCGLGGAELQAPSHAALISDKAIGIVRGTRIVPPFISIILPAG